MGVIGWPGAMQGRACGSRRRFSTESRVSAFQVGYEPNRIEPKWQGAWGSRSSASLKDETKPKFYSLAMFPYPSGNLHMGHARVYTISDTVARLQKMYGKRVLHPMGWDAFGLPAENAAIERGIMPGAWTMQNIAHMKKQLLQLGFDFDWSQEVATCSPEYYKWTQWIFLQMFKRGLAYQRESYVNWDPVDMTVLANEQVDALGKSWRSGAVVEKKLMKQWYLRLTDYVEPLLNDLDTLVDWPEKVKKMQKEWIGKTSGGLLSFKIEGTDISIDVFTTRPDTIYGCTYLVMAPEHKLLSSITTTSRFEELSAFSLEILKSGAIERSNTSKSKRGMPTGAFAEHPITKERIPIYVAEYVLPDYGTGAVMGVPAHDSRDFQFAIENSIAIKPVFEPAEGEVLPYPGSGPLVNSGEFSGLSSADAIDAITAAAAKEGWGKAHTMYNLRDWLVSRQRYWGAPIPIIICDSCGPQPVPEDQLPVVLPVDGVKFNGKGSPLSGMQDWLNCKCPQCGGAATRETDTMDTFVDSAWYFLRYPDATNSNAAFDTRISNQWMPVDVYVGGVEHAILHLLYARFVTKFLHSEGLVPSTEPFVSLKTQGMVHGKTFRLPDSERPIPSDQVLEQGEKAVLKGTGQELQITWEKMSKSKYNGIDPERVVSEYGADTVRLFLLFKAPIEQVLDWDSSQIQGQQRWLKRCWSLLQSFKIQQHLHGKTSPSQLTKELKELRKLTHETIRDVTIDLNAYQFNTAIARLMKLSNTMGAVTNNDDAAKLIDANPNLLSPTFEDSLRTLLLLLAPMAPHFSSEAWEILHSSAQEGSVDLQRGPEAPLSEQLWPVFKEEHLKEDIVNITVQINGKTRGLVALDIAFIEDEKTVCDLIAADTIGQKFLDGKSIKKTIYVKSRRFINFLID